MEKQDVIEDLGVEFDCLIGTHGFHTFTVALLNHVTHLVDEFARSNTEDGITIAKKWAAVIPAARALERIALQQFGEDL